MVLAFGLDHIIVSSDRPKDPAASRFLENTASTRGKPSITAEAGRSGPVDPSDAAVLVKGVLNVLGHLKMSSQAVTPVAQPIWIEPLLSVAAEHDGVFHPLVNRDAHVTKGAEDRRGHRLSQPAARRRARAGSRHRAVHPRRAVAQERRHARQHRRRQTLTPAMSVR